MPKDEYDIIMVTTFVDKEHIYNLLKSINNNNNQLLLKVILVQQDSDSKAFFNWMFISDNNKLDIIESQRIGLSKARNIAITHLLSKGYKSNFIMFPDDDSTFDKTFFERFKRTTISGTHFLTPIFNSNSSKHYKKFNVKNDKILSQDDFIYVGSPNMIINFRVIEQGIKFDEILGVGSKYGSSEDVDFFFKTIEAFPFRFTNELYSYHPAKLDRYSQMSFNDIIKRFRGYSSGFIYVMLKYKRPKDLFIMLIRTIGAALFSLIKLDFRLFLAYFIQFFMRIELILYIWFKNRKTSPDSKKIN